jgi:hypothetical protein
LPGRDRKSLLETSGPGSGVAKRLPRRILFIPWRSEQSDQYFYVDTWTRVAKSTANPKGKDFERVAYNGRESVSIKTLRENDVLYIVGHCSPGSAELFAYQDDQSGIDAAEVALRVIASGLHSDWTGDLKVYACHSASGGPGESFLNRFAKNLRSKEFRCRIWGYKEGISSYPVHELLTEAATERVVGIVNIGSRYAALPDGTRGPRASTVRELYKG